MVVGTLTDLKTILRPAWTNASSRFWLQLIFGGEGDDAKGTTVMVMVMVMRVMTVVVMVMVMVVMVMVMVVGSWWLVHSPI